MSETTTFTPPHPLNTAVLFLVFNRLDTTKQVFQAIRQAKPPRVYIAADGPRVNKEGEAEKVKAVRDYIMKTIDWDCEVKTLFRDKNLGCKYAVSSAITWFFENEEQGIILEDDCLPSQSFFWFCEELLGKYKDDMRVWHIGGSNLQNGIKRGNGDYYFSKYNLIWGWASWSNRWRCYDLELDTFSDKSFLDWTCNDKKVFKFWLDKFNLMKQNKIDTWDFQYTFSMWKNDGLAILPNVNLISNVGFGVDATHTKENSVLSNLKREDLVLKTKSIDLHQDLKADKYISYSYFVQKNLLIKLLLKLIGMFK